MPHRKYRRIVALERGLHDSLGSRFVDLLLAAVLVVDVIEREHLGRVRPRCRSATFLIGCYVFADDDRTLNCVHFNGVLKRAVAIQLACERWSDTDDDLEVLRRLWSWE